MRYLSEPGREGIFEGRAVVFEGSEDYHERINDPSLGIDERTILVIRGAGPLGWPGSAEVVNMQPPDELLRRGINTLPLDPPRRTRERRRGRAGLAANRRRDPHRPGRRALRHAGAGRGD